MLASDIITRCRTTLLDPLVADSDTLAYWKNSELLAHLNAGIATTTQFDKKASVKNETFVLQSGVQQTLEFPGAVAFIDATRNLGSDGLTPGPAIRTVRMEDMTSSQPSWPQDPPSPVTRHVMADPRDPRRFYVWPPPRVGYTLEVQYAYVPEPLLTLAEEFPLPSVYQEAAYQFVLAHAYAKNTKRGDAAKTAYWMQQYGQTLGLDQQTIDQLRPGMPDG